MGGAATTGRHEQGVCRRRRAVIAGAALVAVLGLCVALPARSVGAARPPRALPELGQMGQLVMVTPSVGYALLSSYASTCGVWVAGTTDGGATFSPPVLVRRIACPFLSESLATDAFGDLYVYGDGLYVSHDGGATWHRVVTRGNVLQIVAQGRREWMAETTCPLRVRDIARTCPMALAISTDGGERWSPTAAQPTGARTSPLLVDRTYLLVGPSGPAYVLGQAPIVGGATGRQTLWESDDGGATWAPHTVPCRSFLGADASLSPSGALWSVCAGEPGAGSQLKVVDVSYDQARTWRLTGACGGAGRHRDGNLCEGYAQTLVALSGSRAFLAADRGCLELTNDGGWRWSCSDDINNYAGSLVQVQFLNAEDGVATGGYGPSFRIYHTSDAGQHWSSVAPRWR